MGEYDLLGRTVETDWELVGGGGGEEDREDAGQCSD
jgi:hypothetical protein